MLWRPESISTAREPSSISHWSLSNVIFAAREQEAAAACLPTGADTTQPAAACEGAVPISGSKAVRLCQPPWCSLSRYDGAVWKAQLGCALISAATAKQQLIDRRLFIVTHTNVHCSGRLDTRRYKPGCVQIQSRICADKPGYVQILTDT